MKKLACLLACAVLAGSFAACGGSAEQITMEPETSQMKAICELAVMDCYYHNVAKFKEEDAAGILFWQKDKHFWIEYSGVVSLGIDASQVALEVDDTLVTITIPEAKVLRCQVDSNELSEDSYIVAKDSARISAEDEVAAFAQAQADLEETAASDTALLSSAQQRAQDLLEEYVQNIGEAVGKDYTIQWVYLDSADSAPQPEINSQAESQNSASA
ncbi:DUF4230 domain-containing protein [Subdoligranulum sp. OF01-18]|uniref:DUF4230 domain-containing protein n=1 Tax=Ruthenibacterium lactatiformans TaxID=1550024 RepID=UPI000E74913F|nr:DUF4230 domain-containing protein [Ruthenibacterium lactatiformans]RJW83331.1 DUF4230 domain-containing protein [Subdoligranulum sp. OF01-18]HJB67430.1 DUF4230 domain-containing protein [Candidatus Fournierella excrementigallinarum]